MAQLLGRTGGGGGVHHLLLEFLQLVGGQLLERVVQLLHGVDGEPLLDPVVREGGRLLLRLVEAALQAPLPAFSDRRIASGWRPTGAAAP